MTPSREIIILTLKALVSQWQDVLQRDCKTKEEKEFVADNIRKLVSFIKEIEK